MNRFSDCVWN